MKSVLISIQPKYCELIASGKKTIEVRKTTPNLEQPFKCYIYKTLGKKKDSFSRKIQEYFNCGKVIGEFVCDRILIMSNHFEKLSDACLTLGEFYEYAKNRTVYGWHISDLKIYDKPKELGGGIGSNGQPVKRAFQSWGYIEE